MSTEHGTHFLADKKIVISGGGIAGPAFARALTRLWPAARGPAPRITIYERERDAPSAGREGYSLSLRSDRQSGGIQALQKLGLLDAMISASITEADGESGSFNVWDLDWTPILQLRPKAPKGLPVAGLRIARRALRETLLDGVPASVAVQRGVACVDARVRGGRVELALSDGATDACDLLVAADGANSRLRAALRPHDALRFAGVVCITGTARFPDGAIPAPVGRDWGLIASGTGASVFASPVDERSAVWSLGYLADAPRAPAKLPLDPEESERLLNEALQRGSTFRPPFQALVEATDRSTLRTLNAMDKPPFAHDVSSESGGRVIFVGDSNHAVSPFAGNGANMALMDGWDLAESLCSNDSLDAAVKAYDKRSVPRSKGAVSQSHMTIAIAHSSGWRFSLYMFLLRVIRFLFIW